MRLLQPCSPHRAGALAPPGVLKHEASTPDGGTGGALRRCLQNRREEGTEKEESPMGSDIQWTTNAHASERQRGHRCDPQDFP